jgi:hypothetical protein
MFGGPFVCLAESDIPAVRALIAETERTCAHLIEFAHALRAFDKHLQANATGLCLDELYDKLPRSLAGLIELAYDVSDHASIRLQEELLYGGELDNQFCQELCLHDVRDSERQFFMSTPLLETAQRSFLKLKFRDERVDDLAAMRLRSRPLAELSRRLCLDDGCQEKLQSHFTSEQPIRKDPDYHGSEIRLRYFGHACVLVQTSNTSILIDPVTAFERNTGEATLTFDDLPDRIDNVVLTHGHPDHFCTELLLQLRARVNEIIVPRNNATSIADPSLKLLLTHLGYKKIRVMDPFDVVDIRDGKIVSVPFLGEHAGLNIQSKQCIAISAKGRQ